MSLEARVHEALTIAWKENGYDFRRDKPAMVAIDLLDYASDLEGCTEEEIIPHIKSW